MTHPYDWRAVQRRTNGMVTEWTVGSIDDLLTINPTLGDRAYVVACGAWVVRRLALLTDTTTANRWVPEDSRFGRNNLPAGAGSVPFGTVTTEGVWTIPDGSIVIPEASMNVSYECLRIVFDTSMNDCDIGAPPNPGKYPNFIRFAALEILKYDTNLVKMLLMGQGYPGGAGGSGGTPTGGTGLGPDAGVNGPVYQVMRGGGGGAGGSSVAGGPGGDGGDTAHVGITGLSVWGCGGEVSVNNVGGVASGGAGGDADSIPDFVANWATVELDGPIPVGGGGGGGGKGSNGGNGGAGGWGGGALFIDAALIDATDVQQITFGSISSIPVAGSNAAGGSLGGGGGGGGGGAGGFCRVRVIRTIGSVIVDNVSTVSGAANGLKDGTGTDGGEGGTGQEPIGLLVYI